MDKTMIKEARRDMNRVGVTMLVYYALMNLVAVLVLIADLVGYLTQLLISGQNLDPDAMMQYIMDGAMNNGWMYIVSIAIGLLVVLFWKGKGYWRNEVFVKNNPMTVGSFFSLLCVFLSAQFFFQMFSLALEWLLNQIGFSAMSAVEMASTTGSTFSMYIYICFLGPIAEELLFRGIVLRTLRPWGKQAAILISALVFGLFHGNVVQIPFAFAVGVVLGYVAVEHSILWAIVLHIINNFVVADLMTRLLQLLPEDMGLMLESGIFLAVAVTAIVVLIVRGPEVAAYFKENRIPKPARRGACTAAALIVFAVLMLLMSLLTITPM